MGNVPGSFGVVYKASYHAGDVAVKQVKNMEKDEAKEMIVEGLFMQ